MDSRIGTKNADGSIAQWPEFTICGRDYSRPCRTRRLDDRHFFVLDAFPVGNWQEDEKGLLKQVQKGPVKSEPKRTDKEG